MATLRPQLTALRELELFCVSMARARLSLCNQSVLEATLGAESIRELADLRADAAKATQIADAAALSFAEQASLHGFGSAEWRAMWESARGYSERHAYPGQTFPQESEGTHCVLCQQSLDLAALERMRRFEEFVRGTAQSSAASRRAAAEDATRRCLSLVPGERTRDALDDLAALDETVSQQVGRFIEAAKLAVDAASFDDARAAFRRSSTARDSANVTDCFRWPSVHWNPPLMLCEFARGRIFHAVGPPHRFPPIRFLPFFGGK